MPVWLSPLKSWAEIPHWIVVVVVVVVVGPGVAQKLVAAVGRCWVEETPPFHVFLENVSRIQQNLDSEVWDPNSRDAA